MTLAIAGILLVLVLSGGLWRRIRRRRQADVYTSASWVRDHRADTSGDKW